MRKGLILQNGRIYTLNPDQPVAEAVVLRGPHIAHVGATAEMKVWAGHGGWEVIDLEGGVALPGLTDAHVHLSSYAIARSRLDLYGLQSLEAVQEQVALCARRTPPGGWILGRGWNQNLWSGQEQWPTRQQLDQVAPDHLVSLQRVDGHTIWVNSLALRQVGIDSETSSPAGGEILVDDEGRPTGILKELAADLVLEHIGKPGASERQRLLEDAFAELHAYGLSGVHAPEEAEAFSDYQSLWVRGKLGLRLVTHLPQNRLEEAISLGIRAGFGNEWLRVGGLKIFADGTLGSKTASLLQGYENEPQNRGLPTLSLRELNALVLRAVEADLCVVVHAIGDRAVRLSLDAIDRASREVGPPPIPHRIEHAQLLHPQDLPRFRELGVVASMQPIHCTSDMPVALRFWGEERCRYAYAWRSLLDAGALLAFGSDSPVEPLDPWAGIYAAVTRKRADGTPEEGWYSEECLTVEEALRAYTLGPARTVGEMSLKGSIEEGKLADIIVIDRDIFNIPAIDILDTQVKMNILGGKVVYER
ncbi:MAG: amidohydrolase [Chloroflexia bacterium]|nr:amidohydrolase [Chloroflexia bacterium]